MELVSTLKELLHLHPLYNEQLKSFAAFGGDFQDASRLVRTSGDGTKQGLF